MNFHAEEELCPKCLFLKFITGRQCPDGFWLTFMCFHILKDGAGNINCKQQTMWLIKSWKIYHYNGAVLCSALLIFCCWKSRTKSATIQEWYVAFNMRAVLGSGVLVCYFISFPNWRASLSSDCKFFSIRENAAFPCCTSVFVYKGHNGDGYCQCALSFMYLGHSFVQSYIQYDRAWHFTYFPFI